MRESGESVDASRGASRVSRTEWALREYRLE